MLERVVYNITVDHLNSNNVLYLRQFGFRKKYSTTDAVANLVGEILQGFDNSQMILTVFIDLRKAFDSVSHSVIIRKLRKLGIQDTELQWFQSYLSMRSQHVQINCDKSPNMEVNVGMPQGSLLSVLLFQLQINDLPKSLKYCTSILADDTTLFLVVKSLKFLRLKMQHDLDSLSRWLKANCLKLNVKKTKVMLFNREGLQPAILLEVDFEMIEMVCEF